MIDWYIFCNNEILLQQNEDGTFCIPSSDKCPVALKEWNTIHTIAGVNTVKVSSPLIATDENFPSARGQGKYFRQLSYAPFFIYPPLMATSTPQLAVQIQENMRGYKLNSGKVGFGSDE